jgi:hypothetical protein
MSKTAPIVQEIKRDGGRWPDMLALVNGFNDTAYAMKFKSVSRVSSAVKLWVVEEMLVLDYTTSANVCDSHYIKDFSVRLNDGVLESYAKRLWKSELTFSVDDVVLLKSPLKDLLSKKRIALPACTTTHAKAIFHASELDASGDAIAGSRIGYMAVNGSIIRVKVESIPPGKGTIKIEMDLALYTTRKQ